MSDTTTSKSMTQQERAAVLLDRIIGIIPIQPSQREARIEWLVEYAVETRRAALLECVQQLREGARLAQSREVANALSGHAYTIDRLAQEG